MRRIDRPLLALTALLGVTTLFGHACAQEKKLRRDKDGRGFWILEPEKVESRHTRWLVVLAHGFRGKGEDILWLARAFRDFNDCLIIAPNFVEGFQMLESKTDQQVLEIHKQLAGDYKLHNRIFVAGFSAGAQFAHRFAMRHPDRVIGCAAHAGGTWGPGIDRRARHIPFALSCGLDDVARSSIGQSKNRVAAARNYFGDLAKAGFHLKARLFRRLGHATSATVESQIAECYQLATRGLFSSQARALAAETDRVQELPEGKQRIAAIAKLTPQRFPSPRPNEHTRGQMNASRRAAREYAHGLAGLGGKSADGKHYWIDDSAENQAGWSTNNAAKANRQQVLRKYLATVRHALRPRRQAK